MRSWSYQDAALTTGVQECDHRQEWNQLCDANSVAAAVPGREDTTLTPSLQLPPAARAASDESQHVATNAVCTAKT